MFEGFFKEKGILMVSQAFLDAIATGGYHSAEGDTGVVISYDGSKDEFDSWCSCDVPSTDWTFWDNGTHPRCSKHCYTCQKCNKLLQVG